MNNVEILNILGDSKENGDLFLKIINTTSTGGRITNTSEQKFLMSLVERILSKDDTPLFQIFLNAKIQPSDAGANDTYWRWFISARTPKCLRAYLDHDKSLNLNSTILDFNQRPITILQAAAKRSKPLIIDILLTDARERNIAYDKNGVVEQSIPNPATGILEYLIGQGFSPYTNQDPRNTGGGGVYDRNGNIIHSILFYAAVQDKFLDGRHKILIEHMDDIQKLKREKRFFLAILKAGHSTSTYANPSNHKDKEIIDLLDQKIKFLTEKKLLLKEIKGLPANSLNSKSKKTLSHKI